MLIAPLGREIKMVKANMRLSPEINQKFFCFYQKAQ
jgi:hypothetical protein